MDVARHPADSDRRTAAPSRPAPGRAAALFMPLAACLLSGCSWDAFAVFRDDPLPAPPVDALILRGDRLEAEKGQKDEKAAKAAADLAGAHELYRQGDFAGAETIYHRVADNKKNAVHVAEEARFYEAECLRREERYPKAADTYHKLLLDFPSGTYRAQACQRMFDIADYWLEDTRKEMKAAKDKEEGIWLLATTSVVHWEKSKPLIDEEGRAVELLERIHYNDITGPLADKALFLAGSVRFYREDYREADHYFTQLVEQHRNSPVAPQAIELCIISKHMGTGGPDYDGRKVAEARQMINTALANYPVLATEKKDFLVRQLYSCNAQQAAKDFNIAEFYQRTGHPGSAYFYFEIVRRRYPGTPFFDKATARMNDLRQDLEKEGQANGGPVLPPPDMPAGVKPKAADETAPAPRKVSPTETAPAPRTLPPDETAPAPRKMPGQ